MSVALARHGRENGDRLFSARSSSYTAVEASSTIIAAFLAPRALFATSRGVAHRVRLAGVL